MSSPGRQRTSHTAPRRPSTSTTTAVPSSQPTRSTLPSIESPDRPSSSSRQSQALASQSSATSIFRVPASPRSTGSESRGSKAAKVAIPRLKRSADAAVDETTRSGGRHRVNHACEPCRQRKTKCSGERPVCRHCQDFKITCFYADGKRDRVKKQFGSMTEKVADYERLLKDLVTKVGDSDARAIRAVLEKETIQDANETKTEEDPDSADPGDDSESGPEYEASAGIGSTGALDRVEEDFTREDAKDIGFIGKSSEITWLQRLRQENMYGAASGSEEDRERFRRKTGGGSPLGEAHKDNKSTPMPEFEEGFAIKDSSYHLDDLSIGFEAVDPYEMPTDDTAKHLFGAYLTRVHPSFPIIGRTTLSSQFYKFVAGQIHQPPAQWLAIINLIFAIGAKYSHLIQAEWQGDERDHLIYFSRARVLAMNDQSIFNHPSLQQIQVMGLMSFYLMCTSQINRSWTIAGMAVRAAIALGLNMRSESSKLSDELKEIRYRVWWALYTLEQRLSSLTGRANSIVDDYCTAPLPIPMDEDQFGSEDAKSLLKTDKQQGDRNPTGSSTTPNVTGSTPSTDRSRSASKAELSRSPSSQQYTGSDWIKEVPPNTSLYFLHLVQLTRVSHDVFYRLYNPATVKSSWADVQDIIRDLEALVETWYRNLPPALDFKRKQRDREFLECRFSLGFFYYGMRMTINRPCLCQLNRKLKNQSSRSHNFNRASAASCVDAAKELLALIPDEPNAVGLNSVGPWWNILHWLVQASAVLMLEMSFRASHMPEEAEAIFDAAKKAVRWMHQMGEESFSARRAWLLCNSMLRDAAAKIGREVTDLPAQPPEGRHSVSSQGHSDVSMHSNPYAGDVPGAYSTTEPQTYPFLDQLIRYDPTYPTADGVVYTQAEIDFITTQYTQNPRQDPEGGPSQYN